MHQLTFQTLSNTPQIRIGWETSYTFRQNEAPNRVVTPDELVESYSTGNEVVGLDQKNFDFMEAPEGYFLMNVNAAVTFKRFEGQLNFTNVLNTNYRDYTNLMRYYADEKGFNVSLSLKMQF